MEREMRPKERAASILRKIAVYMDDLLILTGIGCFIRAGFLMGEFWGWIALGAGAIAYGIIVARGGADRC